MNIVNVGYKSTNYYVIGEDHAWMLIDIGWPGTLGTLLANLKRKDVRLQDVRYMLATHYHPDHAGLAQEMKDRGVRLIVLEQQTSAIPLLKTFVKPADRYVDIDLRDNVNLTCDESRAFLRSLDIAGEIVSTPGHSDDSVTLVTDAGDAFTGDLPGPAYATEGAVEIVTRSWDRIRALGARMIYPAHGPAWPLI